MASQGGMCDYCTKNDMRPSELFVGKGPTKCSSCGTRLGPPIGASAPTLVSAPHSASSSSSSTTVLPPETKKAFKVEMDTWCGAEPPVAIRAAWAGAMGAGSADEALALLSEAIRLGCKRDDGARMDDDAEDVAKQAAETAAAALCAEDQVRDRSVVCKRTVVPIVGTSHSPLRWDGAMQP